MARILHIEDDPNNRRLVQKLLGAAGHEVIEAERGVEGIRLARDTLPDLVLVDINIPELDGYEVTLRLRGMPALREVPIVAITAEGDRDSTLAVGCDGFIAKPIDAAHFAETIAQFLGGHREWADDGSDRLLRERTQKIVERLEKKIVELSETNQRLEDIARLRREFLQNVSHELATPMTPVVGYLRLLLNEELGPLTDLQRKCLGSIETSTQRLRSVVDTLLDVSSLETGRMHYYTRPYDFREVATKAIDQIRPKLDERDVTLVERVPEAVWGCGQRPRGSTRAHRPHHGALLSSRWLGDPRSRRRRVGAGVCEKGHRSARWWDRDFEPSRRRGRQAAALRDPRRASGGPVAGTPRDAVEVIYLDHHAAAPAPEAVRRAIQEAATVAWANPSSTHAAGRASRQLLEAAREEVAKSIGAAAADLVLTGGGTEACNLGIRGLAEGRARVVTSQVEHPAVAQSIRRLGTDGREVIALSVVEGQPPSPAQLAPHLGPDALVAIQWVNHETGTVFPIHEYAQACRQHQARLFVDATQALGKVPVDVGLLGADAVAFAAQKVGGPAGAGACWVRRGLEVQPVLDGGSQERGRRPGTPDTLSMVGFGAAFQLGGVPNGRAPRTGTVSNLSFRGWKGPLLAAALDVEGVCVSTGAACSSGLQEPSAAIRAMYPDEQWRAGSAVRISLGIETTERDIETASHAFQEILTRGGA
jgi:cysteine sulfinate desulfinase/cysteine desulfurase-like protein/signal transduction histidine kinase